MFDFMYFNGFISVFSTGTITFVVNIQAENLYWILISKHALSKLKLVEFSNIRKLLTNFYSNYYIDIQ
jgi:hypothetical protein